MVTTSLLPSSHGSFFPSSPSPQVIPLRSATPLLRKLQDPIQVIDRTKGQAFRVLANPNVSSGKGDSIKEVIMVDPLEAKRLAAKQMQQIQAKENFNRKRQIEAINGAWAMIGLTAGLVIEGQTGKSMLGQLVGYWDAVVGFFFR
ncbi:uncharacterized protein LOC116200234 isoform X4 [Punica granatum]|uniref:Uncharacterized protein LOC116200234 isoform X4 n=1 Tax=Punica granatum TaxID=22663 RepID=A0A6P8D6B4_PUNGR|nr:uncharacterized protein LOC116200234 isoform X4 [Punica granatum]